MEATLAIGGLGLRLTGGTAVDTAMRIRGMALFANQQATAQIHIDLDAPAAPVSDVRWLHQYSIIDGSSTARFGLGSDGLYRYELAGATLTCHLDDDRYTLTGQADANVLRMALWTAYSMSGLRHGRLPVHASTVVCHERAVLCLGESGTGKSTHTSLWLRHIDGSTLLNDDCPILALGDGGGLIAYGSPWSGKTDCYRLDSYPVAALVRLEQRPANTIRRLGTLEAFAALQPSCPPCLMKEEHLQDLLIDYTGAAIGRAPLFRLGCRPDAEAALLAHNTIFAQ